MWGHGIWTLKWEKGKGEISKLTISDKWPKWIWQFGRELAKWHKNFSFTIYNYYNLISPLQNNSNSSFQIIMIIIVYLCSCIHFIPPKFAFINRRGQSRGMEYDGLWKGRKGGEMIGADRKEGKGDKSLWGDSGTQHFPVCANSKSPPLPFILIPIDFQFNPSKNNNNNWEMPSSFLLPIFIFFTVEAFWPGSFAGPVNVRIETENNQDFHIGPEPRTRFELVEQYSPLATARQVHQGQSASRAFASSLNKPRHPIRPPKPVQFIVDFGEAGREGKSAESTDPIIGHPHQQLEANSTEAKEQFGPKVITRSQWLEWTRWTKCDNGMRMRIRKCLKINGIPCEGKSEERQKCYSAHNVGTKFGNDPMIIEREITKGRLPMRI